MKPDTKRISILALIFCACLISTGSAKANQGLPGQGSAFPDVRIMSSQRSVLHDDIVHYRFDVAVGPGQFDVIRLHRIVRERHPYWPVRTEDGVFLLPGAPNFFETIFMEPLISQVPPWDQSVAVFLAKNSIDVWGMDYAWALVPPETTDFSFMNGWGLQRDIEHTKKALSLARWIRAFTGQGFGRLHLLGFSYGLSVAYSLAGEETERPPGLRNVKGLIPVDSDFKDDDEPLRVLNCDFAAYYQSLLDAGVYQDEDGVFLKLVGDLAETAPNGVSPFFPPLTNLQFALFVGASGDIHFVGGYFDESGIPTGLRYTQDWLWVDLLQALPPYVPVEALQDTYAVTCNEVDLPFDDHLGEITLPILHVGAAGGVGQYGYYTTTLTASKDVTKFTVQLLPDDERMMDFGHADLFTATDAEALVWRPILNWILAHRSDRP